jgi:hypothetical protein
MVFLIDLPKLPKGNPTEGTESPFLEDLSYFLTAQGVDAAMVQSLRSYDFSETARYAFVHSMYVAFRLCLLFTFDFDFESEFSVFYLHCRLYLLTDENRSGSHMDESWKRTGYSGLGRAVKDMGWASNDPIQVDYIVSLTSRLCFDRLSIFVYFMPY